MKTVKVSVLIVTVILLQTFTVAFTNPPYSHITPWHMKAGFSIRTVVAVNNATALGINTAVNYGTVFTPSDAVGAAMKAKGMREVDAGLASTLYYYECHRTHTVALPPRGQRNTYCATDTQPALNSQAALLTAIDSKLQADARNPLIIGYWVLDDWPLWDSGSAKIILQTIRQHVHHYTPSYPAICGFGVAVNKFGGSNWVAGIAANYSNAGCDMVGIYSYANTYSSYISGSQFDFSMKTPLKAALASLQKQGWRISSTPLLGIGQAFAGVYAATRYEPGITAAQMQAQANAFCQLGATSIGWYAWLDSGFGPKTLTPMSSVAVQNGIRAGIATCQRRWVGH